ncbi:MAG: hypothetical protein A2520_04100 [Deltaproteobacteria bacterium RIFOXYD12_FULL_53_23]|nr:MAG: hypothetical protein A2520_04100 [Deltaproteobacteria bacterium RIFOXYD12_FULL_53_23]
MIVPVFAFIFDNLLLKFHLPVKQEPCHQRINSGKSWRNGPLQEGFGQKHRRIIWVVENIHQDG